MVTNIRIELDKKGIARFLKSDEVQEDMLKRAQAIADRSGPGYVADSGVGHDRAYGVVRTDTIEAMRDNATNHTLLRALHAGGSW